MRELIECELPQVAGQAPRAARRGGRSVTMNLGESPLAWLRARGHVSAAQFEAGERLRHDYEAAQLGPRVTMRWEPAPRGAVRRGPAERPDPLLAHLAAKRRFDAAMAAAGSGLADVLWRVVCAGEGLGAAEQALGWPTRAGKLVLQLALDRLVAHYGIS